MNYDFKVNHICMGNSAHYGGAVVAVDRLHRSLNKIGIDSRVFCGYLDETQPGFGFDKLPRSFLLRYADEILKRIIKEFGLNDIHSLSTFFIDKNINFKKTDILHLHNMHHGYFNYLALPHLTTDKPAVYTMHDMWAFTGHCAYSFQCERWQTGCGRCPDLMTIPSVKRDATQFEWKLKQWAYEHSKLSIVCPSLWLSKLVKDSMLSHQPIYHIPYGIDTDIYYPLDCEESRLALGIPRDKKVLMFGAANLKDTRKGMDLLVSSLLNLPNSLKAEMVLLTFGGSVDKSISTVAGIDAINLGYITNEHQKAMAFSASDLFVFPTRADNLPLVLQESLACGTPMVSFDVGGVPELVRPGITGYLAKPENCTEFSNGIVELLSSGDSLKKIGHNCREIALSEYKFDLQAQRYADLYKTIMN